MGISPPQLAALGLVGKNLQTLTKRVEAAVVAVCQRYSQEGAGYARVNAPWKDHTTNARRGLHGFVVKDKRITARISHGVFYGIYLEKRFSGKYSILPAVLRRYQAPFLEDIRKAVQDAPFVVPGKAKKK